MRSESRENNFNAVKTRSVTQKEREDSLKVEDVMAMEQPKVNPVEAGTASEQGNVADTKPVDLGGSQDVGPVKVARFESPERKDQKNLNDVEEVEISGGEEFMFGHLGD